MHPGYFEAIIQLRECNDESILLVRELAAKKSPEMISKEKLVKGGVDFYIKSKTMLRSIAKALQEQFGGEVIFSRRLNGVSRETSKLIYRENLLIILPPFLKREIISFEKKAYLVCAVNKTKLTLMDLITGIKRSVDFRKNKIKKINETYKTTVSKVYPKLEVLHPVNYESILVQNPKKLSLGEKVNVALFDGKIYLI